MKEESTEKLITYNPLLPTQWNPIIHPLLSTLLFMPSLPHCSVASASSVGSTHLEAIAARSQSAFALALDCEKMMNDFTRCLIQAM